MSSGLNPGREHILARIEAALRTPAPSPASGEKRPIFAPIGDLLDRFQKECLVTGTEYVLADDLEQGSASIARVLADLPPGPVFVQDTPALRRLVAAFPDDRPLRWSSEGAALEDSRATVTSAEALIASTGSILVSTACGGRTGSIVAPVHIVVAGIGQLMPDLEAAFAQSRSTGVAASSSFLCLITGSSRTGDIEKILVKGAHGPRRLIVVLSMQVG